MSVGIVDEQPLLDLCFTEDVGASVDMNLVMTAEGRFIEVQGTGEGNSFSEEEMTAMLGLARSGIEKLIAAQRDVLGPVLKQVNDFAMERLNRKFK